MDMFLLLVRHAVTEATGTKLTGWLPGFSLSEDGRAQAEALAERIEPLPISAIYSSPLERCAETAAAVAAKHALSVQIEPGIGEIKYGDWQGRSLTSLYKTKAWYELRARPGDFRFPGGETIREAQLRGMTAIEEIRKKNTRKMVVVCSHADMIRVLVSGLIGLPLDLYNRMSIAPASMTALKLSNTGAQLLRLSDSGSVDDLVQRWQLSKTPPTKKKGKT